MKCSKCKRTAVAKITYLNRYFCDRCFLKMYDRKVRRTILENKMFNKNDKIMVALSAGKDSMSLLYQLAVMKHFNVVAVLINEGTEYREKCAEIAKKFCKDHKIPLIIKSFAAEYNTTMKKISKKKSDINTCSYCGVLRRNLINKTARELKVDKVATGHNLDDESQTVLMNLYRSELKRLARMGATTGVMSHKMFVPRVKPLRECSAYEDIVHCLLRKIPFETFGCPYRKTAYRNIVREQLDELEHYHPGTKVGLIKNFDQLLPFIKAAFKEEASTCSRCGEVTSGQICQACQMIQELRSS